jgi:transposase
MSRKKKRQTSASVDLPMQELAGILERTRVGAITEQEYAKLKAMLDLVSFLKAELQSKSTSIERLRRMLFGAATEKTRILLNEPSQSEVAAGATAEAPRAKRPGHGRNSAEEYTGAHKEIVRHASLPSGGGCPGCHLGKVYLMTEPTHLVRVRGMAPLQATVYECDRLRCNLCGEVFTATAPAGVGKEKYDASAAAMVAMLRYGTGLPFNRIEKLQGTVGIPLPAATQWDLVKEAAPTAAAVYEVLIDRAADADVVYNDDTTMQVLQLTREQRAAALQSEEKSDQRTGVFTSGILATKDDHQIALFFTGARHAGENLTAVLKRRADELPPPIQMSDALSCNAPGEGVETQSAHCLTHARRKYFEVEASFPEEVGFVLNILREVYAVDAEAKKEGLTEEARLKLHQDKSAPLMEQLKAWMHEQFAAHKVEPNSTLGNAIVHMQTHWEPLTLFLRAEGAPLDNNIAEQALKMAILHRKNSLFYRTLNGAGVGDRFMSLIHTAELAGVNVFDYLVALLRHSREVLANPAQWLPWNFEDTLAGLPTGTGPPG